MAGKIGSRRSREDELTLPLQVVKVLAGKRNDKGRGRGGGVMNGMLAFLQRPYNFGGKTTRRRKIRGRVDDHRSVVREILAGKRKERERE